MESYLGMAAGDSVDAVTIRDIQNSIIAIQKMDDEHGAFWVVIIGNKEEENVLETHKDLTVTGIFPGIAENAIRRQMPNFGEVEHLYVLFLQQEFETVKNILSLGLPGERG